MTFLHNSMGHIQYSLLIYFNDVIHLMVMKKYFHTFNLFFVIPLHPLTVADEDFFELGAEAKAR